MVPESTPPSDLCEHGRVRTFCSICLKAIRDAKPPTPRDWPNAPAKREPRPSPEARVACGQCGKRGTARAFVEDVDQGRFLCRTDAAALAPSRVEYTARGSVLEHQAPTPDHWRDMLRDSRATSIRAHRKTGRGSP